MVLHPSLQRRKYFHAIKNDDGSTTLNAYDTEHQFRYRLTATAHEMTHLGPVLARAVGPIVYDTRTA